MEQDYRSLNELRITYVVYFVDIDPDTCYVSQMKPIAHMENEKIAELFTEFMNKNDSDDPNRTYKYISLY